ncbi:MAG: LysE family translocator [Kangiellaceae bacterium]|nr:LysE family translocator [Kangiellaceae bacterium]MCW8997330.1 LysE family translocator [Kangiellaceae bacterium]MCW9017224.1 LysE family translocator [Kangiellaceae bacterium]
MEYLFSVIVFSVSASVTPGPNNILAMASGLSFGVLRSLPLLFGICVGFSLMLLLVGLGFGQILAVFPQLSVYLKIIGVIYLLYLAYVIANNGDFKKQGPQARPLGFFKGLLFQWINAKAWVVCISAISAFTTPGESHLSQTVFLTVAFLIVGPPCVGIWIFSGALLNRHLNNRNAVKRLNVGMAFLLVASVFPVLKELLLD